MANRANERAEVIAREVLLDNFFHVEALRLRHSLHDGGMSPALDRLMLYRPDAVCALVLHVNRQSLFFVRQFRAGVFEKDHGWLVELAAGLVDDGESPDQAIRREISEEIGYKPDKVQLLQKIHTSPAIMTERIFLYFVEVDDSMHCGEGGGNAHEHEDIEIIEVPVSDLAAYLDDNPVTDAKTLIGLEIFKRLRQL